MYVKFQHSSPTHATPTHAQSKAYANAGLWHINERPALPAPQSGGFVGARGWGAASAAAVAGSLVVAGIVFRYRRTSRHPTSPHKSQV